MVNLEWYRTFKSVYKNGNFSVASKELFMSQPAVSQQIAMLEAHVGYKLFNRKSKGVEPTEYAKLLNNLIIDALDRLENVESGFRAKAEDSVRLISVGISKDLFNSCGSILISKFDFIDFTFAEDDALFALVDAKKLDFAIVTKRFDTFDTMYEIVGKIKLVMVAPTSLDITDFRQKLKSDNLSETEQWLNEQKWYSHDARIPYVKLFWLHAFNKKRPSMVPNYIIPFESEMLEMLSKNTGIAVTWNCNARKYIKENKLQLVWNSFHVPEEFVYLLTAKNNNLNSFYESIGKELKLFLGNRM
ncbi:MULTISPECIES: LysR family transcriptional regulator [Flavobacterium]|uniref:LysR family transcriptional regulator n=2 Tax=Flavobacterium TaxID=237 RepID=A0A940X9G6_9FLAO|nr:MULTISPECIES: LysR family transcriptional regulator [Flavobacterium]MBP4138077.1 LysR family transcriptional regulator [Flavobacterium geliluteum]MDX6180771.1 LysR family transcriptional regulator [Flavobacterium sp. Fl-33]MDX6184371.1 LysR family transcriptional regulator [Flavobacterium sp. Fl-77]UFH39480.1 LysR family transcriptional regulator [Flavobacterium sp. F-70]